MLLSIVSDEELLASIVAGGLALIAATGGIFLNIYHLVKRSRQQNKFVRLFFLVFFILVIYFLFPFWQENYALYEKPVYVKGKVIGYCHTAFGEGVLFQYEWNGVTYQNCNTFFPLPKDSVEIGKTYQVRCAVGYPSKGRIYLRKPER